MAALVIALIGCSLVACIGLLAGSAVVVRGVRVAARTTEEVSETRGVVTVPVQRVVSEGRVDVTVEVRVLGVLPWRRAQLEDVTDIRLVSGGAGIRRSPGGGTSSHGSQALALTTRAGHTWMSPSGSGLIGAEPGDVSAGLRRFADEDAAREASWWWLPVFWNLIGLPFLLVAALLLLSFVRVILTGR